jgi:hypothetical protein
MSQDEVVAIMKARQEDYTLMSKTEWEQTRLMCYYNVVAFGNKVRQPKDLFTLPWDNEMKVVKNVKVLSKDEALQRLQDNRKNKSLNINIKQ